MAAARPADCPQITLATIAAWVQSPASTAAQADATAMRAATVSLARMANCCCTAWNLPIGRPNCVRSLAYCTVWFRMRSSKPAMPMARVSAPSACGGAGHPAGSPRTAALSGTRWTVSRSRGSLARFTPVSTAAAPVAASSQSGALVSASIARISTWPT
ncbi:hypothetical protein D3C85_1343800 [compost metagenome]